MSTPASKIVFFLTACEVTALQDIAIESSSAVGLRTFRSLVRKGLVEAKNPLGLATLSPIGLCLLPVLRKTSASQDHPRPNPPSDPRQIQLVD